MISAINGNTSGRVSFGGIVKVAAVIHDGVPTHDYKIINKTLRKVKKLMLMQMDSPENQERFSALRKMYAFFDPDYKIPVEKVNGETRHIFAKIKSGFQYFLVTGPDAADVSCAGEYIGSSRKLARMTQDTASGGLNYQKSKAALQNYHSVKDEIARNFKNRPQHPTLTIYTTSKFKGGVGILKMNMTNDTSRLNGQQYSGLTQLASSVGDKSTVKTKIVEKTVTKPTVTTLITTPAGKKDDCSLVRQIYRKTVEERITETYVPRQKASGKKPVDDRQMNFFDKLGV